MSNFIRVSVVIGLLTAFDAGASVLVDDRHVGMRFIIADMDRDISYSGRNGLYGLKDIPVTETNHRITGSRAKLKIIKGNSRYLQLTIISPQKDISVSSVGITTGLDEEISSEKIWLIGDVEKIDETKTSVEYYADPLFPISNIKTPMMSRKGIRFVLEFDANGIKNKELAVRYIHVEFTSGEQIVFPVEIRAFYLKMDNDSKIVSNHFILDEDSLAYWYGYDKGSSKFEQIKRNSFELLEWHGLSASSTLIKSVSSSKISPNCELKNNLTNFEITDCEGIVLSAPKFSDLKKGFELNLSIRILGSVGKRRNILSYSWKNRQSGFSIRTDGKNIYFESFLENVVKRKKINFQKNEMPINISGSLPIDTTVDWQKVGILITRNNIAFNVNSAAMSKINLGKSIAPAYGGTVKLGGEGKLVLRDISWEIGAEDEEKIIIESYRLENIVERVSDIYNANTTLNVVKSGWKGLDPDALLFPVNDLRTERRQEVSEIIDTINFIESVNKVHGGFVTLPVDEATIGLGLETNLDFVKEFRKQNQTVPILHTFGSMRANHKSKAARTDALSLYDNLVDIWSVRSSLFVEQEEFFQKQLDKGKEVSIYIHDVAVVENNSTFRNGRKYFWWLYANSINRISFWNVNLWFQPLKVNRPARFMMASEFGFGVSQRNPSGIGAGTIFYPSNNTLLPSIRSLSWKVGIQDHSMLKAFENLAKKNKANLDIKSKLEKSLKYEKLENNKHFTDIKEVKRLIFDYLENQE